MTTIFYGVTKAQVEKQLQCDHAWDGPFIDDLSRYYKCKSCLCVMRDCTEQAYREHEKDVKERFERIDDLVGKAWDIIEALTMTNPDQKLKDWLEAADEI